VIHALVADSRAIRIFEADPSVRSLDEIAVFHNEASHGHERDLVSDRPGRTINTASGMHHAYQPRTRASEHALQMWLRTVGSAVRDLLLSRDSELLVLVASPRVLPRLRKSLPAAVRKAVAREVPLDLVHQPAAALKKRLRPALRAAVRSRLLAEPVHRPPAARKRERQSSV
jgi:protein required for attachment to host cells